MGLRAAIIGVLALASAAGCGGTGGDSQDTQSPMSGTIGMATQCPYGSISQPKNYKLELWNCPLDGMKLELSQQLQQLAFSADCTKKLLSVRSLDRAIDTTWEVMPDGSFNLNLEGVVANIKNDRSGTGACKSPVTADIWGRIDCSHEDQAVITVEGMWHLGQGDPHPLPAAGLPPTSANSFSAAANNNARVCQLPQSCYFHTLNRLKQCQ